MNSALAEGKCGVYRLNGTTVPRDRIPFRCPQSSTAHGFPVSTWTYREVLDLMDRAEERAGPEDVGEQALMRGLDTAFPFFRLGLSWSSVDQTIGHIMGFRNSPAVCAGAVAQNQRA